jgi:hypothetical protein
MMKIRITPIAAVVVLSCILVNAQNSREIERTYRKQPDIYLVSETLWMTPSYSENGQVCMMRVYPRAISKNASYLGPYLDINSALNFINRLFPVETRGRRESGFGMSDLGGGVIWTSFNYDNVQFVFISTYDQTKLVEQMAKSEPVDLGPIDEAAIAESQKREDAKSDDQLMREHALNERVLEIYWPNRKCAKSK